MFLHGIDACAVPGERGPGNCARERHRLRLHDRRAFADHTQVPDHWSEQAHNILNEQSCVPYRRYGHLLQAVRDRFDGAAEGLPAGERMPDPGFVAVLKTLKTGRTCQLWRQSSPGSLTGHGTEPGLSV